MSPESLLLNALKCHLVFAGSLPLTACGRGGPAGTCRRSVWKAVQTGAQPPLCLTDLGEEIFVLRILFTDKMRARA